jgi:hypothetical protein
MRQNHKFFKEFFGVFFFNGLDPAQLFWSGPALPGPENSGELSIVHMQREQWRTRLKKRRKGEEQLTERWFAVVLAVGEEEEWRWLEEDVVGCSSSFSVFSFCLFLFSFLLPSVFMFSFYALAVAALLVAALWR